MKVRCTSITLVAVLFGGTVHAQESRVYRLSYYAPEECPDRGAFSSAIQSNSARVRHALAEETAVSVVATVNAANGEFVGTLQIRHPDGTETTRSVPGARCTDSVEAMALIVALTVDPDAQKPAPFLEAERQSPAATKSLPPTPYDSSYPNTASYSFGSTAGMDTPPKAEPRPARSGASSWQLRAGASAGVVSGNGPEVSTDYGVSLGLAPGSSALSTFIVASAHLAQSSPLVRAEGTAQFRRVVGRFGACPALAGSGVIVLRPCLFLGVGELRVTGSEWSSQPPARMPWFELGATLRAEAKPWGPLLIGTEFGAAFPLVRNSFYFAPSGTAVFEVPAATVLGAIDVGLQI